MVRDELERLVHYLTIYQEKHNEELYYLTRDNFHKQTNYLLIATQFIYLNKTCFNGMWRVNSDGVNNTSIGHKEKVNLFDITELHKCSKALKESYAYIDDWSFENVIDVASKDYFIMIDPPYDNIGENNNSSFEGYSQDNFKSKRPLLLDTFRKLDEIGCKVMMTNHSTPWIMSQFKDYNITTVKANRMIAGKAEDRVPVDEVVITNYKPSGKQFTMSDY